MGFAAHKTIGLNDVSAIYVVALIGQQFWVELLRSANVDYFDSHVASFHAVLYDNKKLKFLD